MDNRAVVRRFAEAAWGDADLSIVDELVAADAVSPGESVAGGPEAFKRRITYFRSGLSDYRTEVEELFGDDDLVAIRFTTTGRHTGELLGVQATGQQLHVTGIGIVKLRDGKIVRQWGENNLHAELARAQALAGAPT